MTFTTTQKIIKIGSSAGVTIPAKELKRAGMQPGDEVTISFKPVEKKSQHEQLMNDYQKFVMQYGQTLKNLSGR